MASIESQLALMATPLAVPEVHGALVVGRMARDAVRWTQR
jgi:hypothetical protein